MPATHVKVTARTFPLTYVVTAEEDTFAFVGVFWSKADLIFKVDGVVLDPAFWTVSGDATQNGDIVVGAFGGGTIELTNPVSNCTVTIDRYVAGTRNTDFSQTAPISQNALNSDLDKLTARDQDQKATLDGLTTRAWDDITGKPTEFPPEDHAHVIGDVTGLLAALDAKLDDSQASDFAAASHTHTASQVSDFDERARDVIGVALTAGAGITVTPSDPGDTITVATTITQYTDEMARDALGTAIIGGAGVSITPNDGADTITVASTITQYTDEMARDALAAALVAGSNVTITVNDGADTITIAATGGGGGSTTIVQPQGRLTLTSNAPVMNADATAQSSVYYAPYVGNSYPWYSGSVWAMRTFAQLTMALDTTNQVSGSLYDLFVWNDGGTDKIGAGPAWTSSTGRGTGAGTTELELKDGIWTNKVSITLKNGAGAGVTGVAANTATYVGTIYCTANGQTGMAFKPAAANGGTANILGVYNAYNRMPVTAQSRDAGTGTDYTYNSTTWRAANASNSNRISWVDGLQQSAVNTINAHTVYSNAAVGTPYIGTVIDSTSATPGSSAGGGSTNTSGAIISGISTPDTFSPLLGFHFAQRMERVSTGTGVWGVASTGVQNNSFTLSLMM